MIPTPSAPRTPNTPRSSLSRVDAGEVDRVTAIDGLRGMSRRGLVPALTAVVGLWGGLALVLRAGHLSLDPGREFAAAIGGGAFALALAGWMIHRLVRRRDYPWLIFVAAAALPLYRPQNTTDRLAWVRAASVFFALALVVVAVYAFVRMVRSTDELERRVNQEALSFAFAASLVLVMAWSLLQEVLPPLRGNWVATAMVATWLVGWNAAVRRYR